ncbi:MAG TPA: HAD family hydrolase [Jatrophihabitantaceae bacterium]
MIRLLATDLDGTLLRADGSVSPRTTAALRAAEHAGLLVVFVTGRPPRWLDPVADATGHLGVAVGANGAVIYDLKSEQVVNSHPLDPAEVLAIADEIRGEFPDVDFAVEFVDSFAAEPGYVHDWVVNPERDRRGNLLPPPPVGELRSIVGEPVLKLLAKDHGADVDRFRTEIDGLLGDRASVTHSSSIGLLEIGAPGVTKATGLAEVAGSHGIDRDEVVAIGDMPNDIAMLHWAGTSYAVANAHPDAQAAAGSIVGSNEDDAVAIVLEELLAAR